MDERAGVMYTNWEVWGLSMRVFSTGFFGTARPDMAKQLRIRINWPQLLANTSKQEGRTMTRVEVEQWLTDAGFVHEREDFWIVSEPNLGHLDPSEVISAEDA
ncbi:MAG TPA: hypothetical protein VGR35_22020 [Tepidisphaeraceae bacterium]|nr:hypothetical protein [Tepidisphaeraceae bacterium]